VIPWFLQWLCQPAKFQRPNHGGVDKGIIFLLAISFFFVENNPMQTYSLLILFFLFPVLGHGQNVDNGKKLYGQCIQCHGAQGQGVVLEEGPKIGGQFDWYIVSQLQAFLSGTRKNPKMQPFIKSLSASDLKDLGAYIMQLK